MRPQLYRCLASIALVAMSLVAYGPVLQADFLDFDDQDYVFANPRVSTGLQADNLAWAFTHSHSGNWHPLTWISHMVDVEVFGLDEAGARGHHGVNLAIHALNALLLFALVSSMTRDPVPSFFVAAVFAVHPAAVETVAWVAQRKTLLSTLFAILSIASYVRFARRGKWAWYGLSLAAFATSLMAKQTFVPLPFALLLLDYWPLNRSPGTRHSGGAVVASDGSRSWTSLAIEKVPFVMLAALASLITINVQTVAMQSLASYSVPLRLENAVISYVRYMATLAWPVHLSIVYPLHADEITLQRALPALAVLAIVTWAVWHLRRRRPYLLVGWLWFLGMLIPMIGLVHVGEQAIADRYTYSSYWGLLIAVVWFLKDLIRSLTARRIVFASALGAASVVLAILVWVTHQRATHWRNTTLVFEEAVAHTRRNWMAHQVLAMQYARAGRYQHAIDQCQASLQAGQDALTLAVWASACQGLGLSDEALAKLNEAIRVDPNLAYAHSQLGDLYAKAGDYRRAIDCFSRAAESLSLPSNQAVMHNPSGVYRRWASALAKMNRLDEAIAKYETAVELAPNEPSTRLDAARINLTAGRTDRAAALLASVLDGNPRNPDALALLGFARARQGRNDEARRLLSQAIEQRPDDHETRLQLVKVLLALRLPDEADAALVAALAALEASPTQDSPRYKSNILVQQGEMALARRNVDLAIQRFQNALEAWPDNPAANNNLAWVLAASPNDAIRNAKRAVALAERACALLARHDYATLGTLAAAYAADGRFPEALAALRQAIPIARDAKDQAALAQLQRQLLAHEQGRPYIDSTLSSNANPP